MRLSIVICAYNAERRLPAVLDALEAQRGVSPGEWEVVVVDNNSRDETTGVAHARSNRLPVRVVREARQGLIRARERGVREARGDVLSYIDDDNVVDPGWCRACIDFADAHPRAGVFGGRVDPIFEDPASRPPDFEARYAAMLALRDLGDEPRLLLPPHDDPPCGAGMTGPTRVLRTILLEIGVQLTGRRGRALTAGEDSEIGWLVHRLGWEMWYTPALRMGHVIPPGRLVPDYLERLEVGMARTWPWLRLLAGREPRRARAAYMARAFHCQLRAASARLRAARRGGRPEAAYHRFFARRLRAEAAGYWDMALRRPIDRILALGPGPNA